MYTNMTFLISESYRKASERGATLGASNLAHTFLFSAFIHGRICPLSYRFKVFQELCSACRISWRDDLDILKTVHYRGKGCRGAASRRLKLADGVEFDGFPSRPLIPRDRLSNNRQRKEFDCQLFAVLLLKACYRISSILCSPYRFWI